MKNGTIVVSCAGDNELAKVLYAFLAAKFPKVKTSIIDDEIYILSLRTD
jgi:hypothetical protein